MQFIVRMPTGDECNSNFRSYSPECVEQIRKALEERFGKDKVVSLKEGNFLLSVRKEDMHLYKEPLIIEAPVSMGCSIDVKLIVEYAEGN